MRQFGNVSSQYGAPMGRTESLLGEVGVSVFCVHLDSGGYDDGGAYWGTGAPLYCAQCPEGGRQFVRADSRLWALVLLGIRADQLARKPNKSALDLARFGAHNMGARLRELGYYG